MKLKAKYIGKNLQGKFYISDWNDKVFFDIERNVEIWKEYNITITKQWEWKGKNYYEGQEIQKITKEEIEEIHKNETLEAKNNVLIQGIIDQITKTYDDKLKELEDRLAYLEGINWVLTPSEREQQKKNPASILYAFGSTEIWEEIDATILNANKLKDTNTFIDDDSPF